MRENPDGFLSPPCGFAAEAALFPVYRWDLTKRLKPNDARSVKNRVATGHSPVAQAAPSRA